MNLRIFVFLIVFVFACEQKPEKLTIAVASNMQFAMTEIQQKFVEETKIECEIVYSSSGKLFAQIKEGAPYDVFVSADMEFPKKLYEEGLSDDIPAHYASGLLVLYGEGTDIRSILKNPNVHHMAIANPRIAPYGRASKKFLENYGVYELLKEKLVFGENIQQTAQFVETGAAEIGIVAKSFTIAAPLLDLHWIELDTGMYQPIKQGVVVLTSRSKHVDNAIRFRAFLLSKTSRNILKRYGYQTK